ncbi:LPS translocon maturation chaperone LptM [Polaromonas sp. SM01]|uniref:LPS translocon maturation chaperone LptM n=1 Tax=Polaromonas sp. SM01 TaxID=3085630 RepID=UPI003990A689
MFARFHIRAQILGCRRVLSWGHGLCTLILAVAGAASLSACGQKGPLFLPPPPKVIPTAGVTPATPASQPATPVTTSDLPEPPEATPPTFTPR